MPLQFTKMHGVGNDYVYVDGFDQTLPDDVTELAVRISDRHTGVGGDGLILILPSTDGSAHVRMRMFNNDGSEGEMCGNGIRCVAKYTHDHGLSDANPLRVETGRGVLNIDLQLDSNRKVESATVDMGEPFLDLEKIPVQQTTIARNAALKQRGEHRYGVAVPEAGGEIEMTFVNTGNPHAVIFVDDLSTVDLPALGPAIERHAIFPKKANVHFVQVLSDTEVKVLHWERGTGQTQACGTGATAVCIAGALVGRTARAIKAHLPGGTLDLRWDEKTNHVFMTGPATEVFTGEWRG
jgi:diaminopimelate epimerase